MLSAKQLTSIKKLQTLCEKEDSIQLKLNWDMLESRTQNEPHDYFKYEGEELIAFLGLYGFGSKIELCGMVHPSYRRKGLFTQLVQKATDYAKSKGYRKILLNYPLNSSSGEAFVNNIPHQYEMTEYQMKWEEGSELQLSDPSVSLRPASETDLTLEIQLDVQCFGFSEDDAVLYNQRIKEEDLQDFYIVEQNGVGVGKLRFSELEGDAWIYGFAVLPAYQGKGIGRNALIQAVKLGSESGSSVYLEVEAKNERALSLYTSVGFQIIGAQAYVKYGNERE
ncbi:GNAT family acetyltransferase [Bacillus coahuilensis m2-6]|uniref:GNAT family acetyltransferase n=1 Tax=Bacillus coahuilensis p1.1.43 TaxID=1150625 RepID=A0A147KCG0_9BACI|nr:GNAT family N-acetyltransferase [Bacillus coahuilensis]KUP09386.1 GNAT family acetyltransferase [Bacillus coahuilensis p1.1.43]KUP09994.1 GNAT family acetyltransferase [Bacillus coahuilensis m2-6]